jgi:hypothetical protein
MSRSARSGVWRKYGAPWYGHCMEKTLVDVSTIARKVTIGVIDKVERQARYLMETEGLDLTDTFNAAIRLYAEVLQLSQDGDPGMMDRRDDTFQLITLREVNKRGLSGQDGPQDPKPRYSKVTFNLKRRGQVALVKAAQIEPHLNQSDLFNRAVTFYAFVVEQREERNLDLALKQARTTFGRRRSQATYTRIHLI